MKREEAFVQAQEYLRNLGYPSLASAISLRRFSKTVRVESVYRGGRIAVDWLTWGDGHYGSYRPVLVAELADLLWRSSLGRARPDEMISVPVSTGLVFWAEGSQLYSQAGQENPVVSEEVVSDTAITRPIPLVRFYAKLRYASVWLRQLLSPLF